MFDIQSQTEKYIKQLHFNKPQLTSMVIGAPSEVLVAGRDMGKSEGVLAPKSAKCYRLRSTGVLIAAALDTWAFGVLESKLPYYIESKGVVGWCWGRLYLRNQN